ncbi:phosphatase PAP2 family protein [Rheinheimera aquimaris]|uniref:phosphatase PAP2 family protein n=1 Tax=Rheinheimera aquimaris TaxID=412437 RepID=UPI001064BD7B|nr:phosphatase PAP2 family protein [Rheinheimera aquimaris]
MLIKQFVSDSSVHRLLFLYVIAWLLLDVAGGDIWLASKIYAIEGYQWSLQQHWLTESILHRGARQLNYVCCAIVLIATVVANFKRAKYKQLADSLLALSLALLSAFVLVAYLKAITNIACPWDLAVFGGTEPYIHLLQKRPSYLPYKQCFPAGHASVGYAWVALYYFLKQVKPGWRFAGLATGLISGLVLGIAQQLRGAHFLSHDITTLLLSLLCAKFCFMLISETPTTKESTYL